MCTAIVHASQSKGWPGSPVGAGLLATTVCQSTSWLSEPPLSRASPLPHLIFAGFAICVHLRASIGSCLHHCSSLRIARP
ncbi:hypothetical protein C1X61_07135 [Pseudomonas sp. FW215-T2]|nr:hypothetical protein C1X61_07135 [Pseudomonas sp. FW215-T2]PNA13818.1 hypothetical protein C1X62_09485 [Pseudomonas sp. FW215-R3]